MYCNFCGKVIQDDANVCAYCGRRVGAVAARKQLLTVFEAAGPMSDVTKQGRRRLSSILFS